ncbi:MAG TPA: histone deacetylase [Pirellulales bacterium]|jgi:acetoin utilization deacetylase AcuC-like enzyme
MTLLYYDPRFLDHRTGAHPERPQRLEQIVAHLARTGLDSLTTRPAWEPVTDASLGLVHSLDYARELAAFAQAGGGHIESDTVVCAQSYDVARLAAGAATDAVRRVVAGEDRNALCLVRPPGHHALVNAPMGFCLFNNIAVAAAVATRELGLDRVLIVDWDVHHGNGTQDMFWEDPRVGFFSIHRWPFYPGTGWKDETGTGDALGSTLNLPIEFGLSRKEYIRCFADSLDRFATRIQPQLVLVSAGFDSHAEDPVGSLGLEIEDFEPLTDAVLNVADSYADGRLVSVLEGGYNPGILAGCVEVHLRRLLGSAHVE